MAETIGWLTDKIIVSELKIFHTGKQLLRADVNDSHRELCRERIRVLSEQRDDLVREMNCLYASYRQGSARPKVYRQFKMYNDPRFQVKKPG